MTSDITPSLLILDVDVLKWKYSVSMKDNSPGQDILCSHFLYFLQESRSTVFQDTWELAVSFSAESLRSKSLMVPEHIKSGLMSRCCSFKHCEETLLVLLNIMVSRSNRLANANVALRYVNTEKLKCKKPWTQTVIIETVLMLLRSADDPIKTLSAD